jgi:hypothetical protein
MRCRSDLGFNVGGFRIYLPSALDVEKRVLQAEKLEGLGRHDCVV